jgi:glycosyltransferase involved in cell wall biosynthesis
MAAFSIAFGTRELWPFVIGGGIGRTLHGTVRLLASQPDVEVTVITRETFREEYEQMRAAGDPRLPPARFEFLEDPRGFDLGAFSSYQHAWSARVYERLCDLYPDGGPDLVEFSDYLGEGFVTAQARRAGLPALRNTRVLLRLRTSLEIVDALNEKEDPDEELRSIYTLERGPIALADHILSPGGDVLGTYQRFYGADAVAPGGFVQHVIAEAPSGESTREPPASERTRLLFVGRLERRKGVEELVQAATRLGRDDWELTLLGGDTDTASVGGSMREHLMRLAGGHERIDFHERVPHERALEMMDEHHVVLIPSLWECWSNVSREALLRNRPVLASPTGALPDAAVPGVSGWLTEGTSSEDVERAIGRVLDSRAEIDAMIREGRPRARLDQLLDPEGTLRAYRDLAAEQNPAAPDGGYETVSAVVVSSAGSGSIQRTLASLRAQTPAVDEVVLVCDGLERVPPGFHATWVDSFELLPPGAGPEACRNAGCDAARGGLILLVDAGMEFAPGFLDQLLEALRLNRDAAYASAWAQGLDPSAVPLGNYANFVFEHDNAAVAPLVRREVFERGHRFDPSQGPGAGRTFWAALAADRLYGCVVPERLVSWAPFSWAHADTSLTALADQARSRRSQPMSWLAP